MTKKATRILLVDDEPAVLDALVRQHRKLYTMVTACGAEEGLEAIENGAPFAAVVSDFQMPGMTGTQFLARVRELRPEIVRVMLTGQADLTTAMEAVNRGHIFRFLTKPCEPDVFRDCLEAAVEQYELRHAERLLLEHTVKGSIEVLAEVLALSNPAAFGKAVRIRDIVRRIVSHLRLADPWKYETAALLSQIGCVAVPHDIFDRMAAGETLPSEHMAILARHPALARDLLMKIPRLQEVADIVSFQADETPIGKGDSAARAGGRILSAALEFVELLSVGAAPDKALAALQKETRKYSPKLLEALAASVAFVEKPSVQLVRIGLLRAGMVLEQDVCNGDGRLIVARGHVLSPSSLQRIRNYAELGNITQKELRVRTPEEASSQPRTPAA